MFTKVGEEKVIVLDEQEVRGDGEAKRRRGGTRETKNIGLMVALERKEGGGGVVSPMREKKEGQRRRVAD